MDRRQAQAYYSSDGNESRSEFAGDGHAHPPAGSPSGWRFVAPVALVLLVLLVFMPALDAGLVDWDDDDLLLYNTRYRTLSAENLRWMFTTSFAGHFQPLTWLTYALDWALWKRETFGYHLTSVLLHAFTAVAFYFVTRRLLAFTPGRHRERTSKPLVLSAAFAAALFAVHPLRAESVAWLAERRDVLAAFFYVLAVAFYLRYAGTVTSSNIREVPSFRRWSYTAAVASCVISLLAKASAITLPVVLLILDTYPLRRWSRSSAGKQCPSTTPRLSERRGHNARIWFEKLPFFLLAIAAGVRAIIAQHEGGALYSLTQHDIWARLAQACYGITFYMWKMIWPTNLGPLYEIPPRGVLFGAMLWVSVVVLVAVTVAAVHLRRRFPAVPTVLAVYVVMLLPVLGFVQSGPQLVADRYSYLSCMGFAVLAGGGLLRLLETESLKHNITRRAFLALLAVFLVTCLSWATFYGQAQIWTYATRLWARGVEVSPYSAIAHTNYADALVREEMFAEAARHYERALTLNPYDAVAFHHLADLLRRSGRKDAAIRLYLRSLSIDPDRLRACVSVAELLIARGRALEAVQVLRDGARRHPEALDLIDYLAQLLSTHPDKRVRNGDEAVKWAAYLSRARGNDDAPALLTLATAYAEAGRFDEAVQTAERALIVSKRDGNDGLSAEIMRRLALFRKHRAYRFGESHNVRENLPASLKDTGSS